MRTVGSVSLDDGIWVSRRLVGTLHVGVDACLAPTKEVPCVQRLGLGRMLFGRHGVDDDEKYKAYGHVLLRVGHRIRGPT